MSTWKKCNCGSTTWDWSFTGWDEVNIDADGAYHRRGKGEYQDSEITCKKCKVPYDSEDEGSSVADGDVFKNPEDPEVELLALRNKETPEAKFKCKECTNLVVRDGNICLNCVRLGA